MLGAGPAGRHDEGAFCTNSMGIEQNNKFGACVGSSTLVSSSDVVQNDQLSARNLMAIARMPEDHSKTYMNKTLST
eukprot:3699572-Heterocapsa_arctica.AAC.1